MSAPPRNSLRMEIVARDFNRLLQELAAIDPRVEFRTVVVEMAGRVVQGAMNRTRAAQASSIRRDFESREYTTLDGKRYKLTNSYPDALWARIREFRRGRLEVKLASRGLSKRSWHHLGTLIGAALRAPAYVTSAAYKGNSHPENARREESGTGPDYALTIINSSPIVQAAGGYGALIAAMAGETRRFEILMEQRAFRTVQSRAKAYPGIFVLPGAAAA